jgi:hypothetical protein
MKKVRTALILCAVALFAWPAARPSTLAQEDTPVCDPKLLELSVGGETGYMMKGGRCEGFYRRQVSTSAPLTLKSFMAAAPGKGSLPSPLRVSWLLAQDRPVDLRASALKPKVYFQMDVRAGSRDRVYDWPTDALSGSTLGLSEIGLTASYAEGGQRVYVPTRILNAGQADGDSTYVVAIWPEQSLQEVFISVSGQNAQGKTVEVQARKELGRGLYPASRAIQFSIPRPSSRGRYELAVSASFVPSGGVSLIIPFETSGGR